MMATTLFRAGICFLYVPKKTVESYVRNKHQNKKHLDSISVCFRKKLDSHREIDNPARCIDNMLAGTPGWQENILGFCRRVD